MKKTFWIVLMLCMAAYGIFAEDPSPDSVPASITGVIQKLTGKVQLKTADSSVFVNAKAGDEIEQSTVISTGIKSTAVIVVGGSVINVGPLTRLSLAEMQNFQTADEKQISPPTGKLSCCP